MKQPYFISVDWGTSNFRAWLVDADTREIQSQITRTVGIKELNQQFLSEEIPDDQRQAYFTEYLIRELTSLSGFVERYPVVISGMASSSIGLKNIPYANVPIDSDGSQLICDYIDLTTTTEAILISGVRTEDGMMRGEEVQAIGLSHHIPTGEAILLLPGTHSKHVLFQDRQVVNFKNYMTGELFAVLTTYSILSNSVSSSSITDESLTCFLKGVKRGAEGLLSSSLFGVRANDLLHGIAPEDNSYYLSGLLIGDELRYLIDQDTHVILAASEPLFALYKHALDMLMDSSRLTFLGEEDLEQAVIEGHAKIINRHNEG